MDISTINKRFEKVAIIERKEQLREQIAQDVQQYLKHGGKIDVLPSEEIQPHNMAMAFDGVSSV